MMLQQKLQELRSECDRLANALAREQSEHEQTRQTLMTALGDTVEQLERERKRYAQAEKGEAAATLSNASQRRTPQSQLPEQPQKQLPSAQPSGADTQPR